MHRFMIGVMAAATVAALAPTPAGALSFNGCVNLTNGKLRKLTFDGAPPPTCSSRETPVVVDGDPPTAPDGPSDGLGNCQTEELPGTNQANTFSVLNVSCSAGRKIASAGAIWHTPFDAADNGPFYMFPRSATTWTVIPWNHTASTQDYRVIMVCCAP